MDIEKAEEKRFNWQTGNPYVVSKETELLRPFLDLGIKGPALEIGCGEGANITNLRRMGFKAPFYGIDLSFAKLRFCSSQTKGRDVRLVCGNALKLPFENEAFGAVLLRDLLHHVDGGRKQALCEALRVCKKEGHVFIVEANGLKFTNRIFGLAVPSEKGVVDSTPKNLKDLLGALQVYNINITMKEPSNLFRVILHYRFGVSALGRIKAIKIILDWIENLAKRMMPIDKWAYIAVVIKR